MAGLLAGTAGSGAMLRADAPKVSLRPQARPEGAAGSAGAGAAAKPSAAGADALIREAQLGGIVSFAVMNTRTGQALESHKGSTGLPPASVTKAITALYALDTLGAGYRFKTRLIATGPVTNGRLNGDLVLAGGGDPTLDTDGLADLARQLKLAGVREVSGKFKVYGGALPFARVIDKSQPEHVGYNPAVSGLNLNFNRVHFEWKRSGSGYAVTMDARSAKYRPEVRVARMQVKARALPVYTYKDAGSHDAWTVARDALGKGGSRWLPVRRPEAYAGEVFATFARAHGIRLGQAELTRKAPGGQALATRQSAPLRDILRDMLKYSTNLTAEVVGMAATAIRKGQVGSIRASAEEMTRWARASLGMGDAKLVDHSGLGAASRLSAAALAAALVAVRKRGVLRPILKDIAMRDAKGKVIKSHPIKVSAKTGTLYFVSTLAGYMTAPDGTELAFAIFAADSKRRAALVNSQDDRPAGSRGWNKRAKQLQQKLIERWGTVYGS